MVPWFAFSALLTTVPFTHPFCRRNPQHVMLHVEATFPANLSNVLQVQSVLTRTWFVTSKFGIKVPCTTWQHEVAALIARSGKGRTCSSHYTSNTYSHTMVTPVC